MKRSLIWILGFVFITMLTQAVIANPMMGMAGNYHVTVTSVPVSPHVGENNFSIAITDKGGKPVSGAEVKLFFSMPSMGMRGPIVKAEGSKGVYTAKTTLSMHTDWRLVVSIKPPKGEKVKASFHFKV